VLFFQIWFLFDYPLFLFLGDTIHFSNPELSEGEWRWGNFLSTYYHMLGLALLGNLNFHDTDGFLANEHRWLKQLDDVPSTTWLRYYLFILLKFIIHL
jgi:hypothetical protein